MCFFALYKYISEIYFSSLDMSMATCIPQVTMVYHRHNLWYVTQAMPIDEIEQISKYCIFSCSG